MRAAEILKRADIVLHDALVHADTIALAAKAECIAVGKRCGRHSTAQRFINKRLVDAAREHAVVVRLKGGDPMLFGRAQEEIDALEATGIDYEVVPGITAAVAASAHLGTSLTQRGSARSVAFVTPRIGDGHDPAEWVHPLIASDAGAIYMGVGQAAEIAQRLIAAGMSERTPLVIVENASLPDARRLYGTLASLPALAAREMRGPAIILIGSQF